MHTVPPGDSYSNRIPILIIDYYNVLGHWGTYYCNEFKPDSSESWKCNDNNIMVMMIKWLVLGH